MNRVFVITVRDELLYPEDTELWNSIDCPALGDKIKQNVTRENSRLDMRIVKKVIEDNDVGNDIYNIYLVSSLKETNNNDAAINMQKTQYLENVVCIIMSDLDIKDLSLYYLIAHKEDFNSSEYDVIANKTPDTGNKSSYNKLTKLVDLKHVYLFQHEDNCKVYNHLYNLINLTKKEECNKILHIVDNESKMISFFQEVDNNKKYNYSNRNNE